MPRTLHPALAIALALWSAACLQSDQKLPFELDEGASATGSIGPAGGTVSLASGVAVTIPAGALTVATQITLTPRLDASFPGDAGRVIPGTVFDLAPEGLALLQPARVALRIPGQDVSADQQILLGVAQTAAGRSDLLASGSYDATARLLTAELTTLGPVAAVLADDAIPVGGGTPPTLGGGVFSSGASGVSAPQGSDAPAPVDALTQRFVSVCRPEARRCFSSGLLQVWASPELLDRLGGNLAILAPRLAADLTFGRIGATGVPAEALGRLSIRGTLRVQLGRGVSSYEIDETFNTGTSAVPSTTSMRIQGNRLVLDRTTDGSNRTMEYELKAVGTGRMLTIRAEEEVELENDDGSTTTGTVIIHVRLRG